MTETNLTSSVIRNCSKNKGRKRLFIEFKVFGSTMFYYKSVLAWKKQHLLARLKG